MEKHFDAAKKTRKHILNKPKTRPSVIISTKKTTQCEQVIGGSFDNIHVHRVCVQKTQSFLLQRAYEIENCVNAFGDFNIALNIQNCLDSIDF